MESMIREKIDQFLDQHKIIGKSQHGFRKGKSCQTNLLEFFFETYDYANDKIPYDVIYFDFEKAFDKVPHKRLINKLEANGITGKVSNWIENWLKDRTQKVLINGQSSSEANVVSGVPQGSVLGPILFTIYINDIDEDIRSKVAKFADDTKIGGPCKTIEAQNKIQTDINKLYNWSQKWLMSFNVDKCKVMHFGKNNPKRKYYMNNNEIKETTEEKDLGVIISNDLKSKKHVNILLSKANRLVGFIKRTLDHKTMQNVILLYKALIRPILEYCGRAWHPSKTDAIRIEKVQQKILKMIPELRPLRNYDARLKKSKLFKLSDRRERGDAIQLYRILTHIDEMDYHNFITYDTRGHRSNGLKITRPNKRTKVFQESFYYRPIENWNKLPEKVVEAASVCSFKRRYDQEMLL